MLKGVTNSVSQNNNELLNVNPTSEATTSPVNIKIGKLAIKKLMLNCLVTSGLIVFIRATRSKKTFIKWTVL